MAIWIVLAADIGDDGRVERVRWQREGAEMGGPIVVEAQVVARALRAGDKVYTLKPCWSGTAVTEVRPVEYPGGAQSIEPDDVRDLPGL